MKKMLQICKKYLPSEYISNIMTNKNSKEMDLNNINPIKENKIIELNKVINNDRELIYKNKDTKLILACINRDTEYAIELINISTESILKYINKEGDTTLIIACKNNLDTIAIKLIKTGECDQRHINNEWKTALMYACINKMTTVALELLKFDNCSCYCYDREGNDALAYAYKNNLIVVLNAITMIINEGHSNYIINTFGYDEYIKIIHIKYFS